MAFNSLRDFIDALEERNLLKRVSASVDWNLEMTEIVDRLSKLPNGSGPAILFETAKGSEMPVLMNAFGCTERMALALGSSSLDEVADRLRELIRLPLELGSGLGLLDKLRTIPRFASLAAFIPKVVNDGPSKEVVRRDGFSLLEMPVLKCWPFDGGRFITLPLVFTKDPQTGQRNLGMYRMQVYDDKTTGMHWHIHKDGARHARRSGRIEVAVAIGADPAVVYAATAPLPPNVDELLFAGFLRNSPVKLVKCETVDLEVPATAEIILEGYVDAEELRVEGPFGDHTGFYSPADLYPVFHVTCMAHRRNPIYMATVVGRPPMEDCYMGKATERIFLPLLQLQLPEIKDICLPFEGVFHNCVLVSIDKQYPGHAQKVMHALWGLGQMMFSKLIVVVDSDVDVQDVSLTCWRALANVDWSRDATIVRGPVDALDHASAHLHLGAKLGVDATRKWPSEGHDRGWPEPVETPEDIKSLVDSRWEEYGLGQWLRA